MRALSPEGEGAVSSTASFYYVVGMKPVAIKAGATGPCFAQLPDVGMPNCVCTGGRATGPRFAQLPDVGMPNRVCTGGRLVTSKCSS
jgi:hypothetical protein